MLSLIQLSRLVLTSLALSGLGALPALALTAVQSVETEIRTQGADGHVIVKYVPATLVTPGETIIYRLTLENDGLEPAADLNLVMPVPAEITYIEGSAERENARVTYSANAGQTYSSRESLNVKNKDGTQSPAQTHQITHLKWTLSSPLSPGQSHSLLFKGKLK